jgi:hypothetical protein
MVNFRKFRATEASMAVVDHHSERVLQSLAKRQLWTVLLPSQVHGSRKCDMHRFQLTVGPRMGSW